MTQIGESTQFHTFYLFCNKHTITSRAEAFLTGARFLVGLKRHMKIVHTSSRSRTRPPLDILLRRRPAVTTRGSIICCSSFTTQHQRENAATAASPVRDKQPPTLSRAPTQARAHAHTLTHVSIKLFFRQRTGFISETNGVLRANADLHVSLIHFLRYAS